ncbi:hypothetical protein CFK37_00600 [Virgibacillus phasianinus]|uniref:Uncharacterized protein n=1 Tax=Virgibacillus phasianinus TaxID=2017483 RepID=A0A220TYH3_9BACI|nr:hypothetical protein [Virgibacillus phasianinus]ASK60809.1 hypothetical protein CFK37_00600 [Virgibacillus phasianinus]
MIVCVTNCLHWIGFHLVNRFIENDVRVDGLSELTTDREEQLSFMLGRNSSFSLYHDEDELKGNTYTDTVLIDAVMPGGIQSVKTYRVGAEKTESDCINISLPFVFGEWMPMDEQGMYVNQEYIRFDDTKFQTQAIYVGDFVDCLMQWMKIPVLPKQISLTRDKNVKTGKETLEKQLYIRENRPIDEKVSEVINHYKKLKNYL